jgi:hypothetical protein
MATGIVIRDTKSKGGSSNGRAANAEAAVEDHAMEADEQLAWQMQAKLDAESRGVTRCEAAEGRY